MKIQKVQHEREIAYLENMDALEIVENGELGAHIVDVVFVRDGERHRYQLSEKDIYDVDRNIYYRDTSDVYSDVFDTLYTSKKGSSFTFLLPLIVVIINAYSMNYYKRLGISEKDIVPKTVSFYLLIVAMLIVIMGSMLYVIFIGPVFIPLPIMICLVLAVFMWRYFTRHIQDVRILKLERIKLIILMIVLVLLFFISF